MISARQRVPDIFNTIENNEDFHYDLVCWFRWSIQVLTEHGRSDTCDFSIGYLLTQDVCDITTCFGLSGLNTF